LPHNTSFDELKAKLQEEKIVKQSRLSETKSLAVMGMLGALAAVLMLFEVPLLFVAPNFYGLDLAEVPVLVGTFALGPLGGMIIEVVKILIKLLLKPTTTGFVGEFANLVVGCSLILPAGLIYQKYKTKKGAVAGMLAGTITMTAAGVVINALVMLPFYSNFMPLETILAAGSAINPAVSSIWTFAVICVGPFNLIKGAVVSFITALIYKRISYIIHSVGKSHSSNSGRLKI